MTDDHAIPRLRPRLAAIAVLAASCLGVLGAGPGPLPGPLDGSGAGPGAGPDGGTSSASEADPDRGDELKPVLATLIVRFCNYVTWPEDAFDDEKSKIVIGIVGDDELSKITSLAAKKRKKKTAKDRDIDVRPFASLVGKDGTPAPLDTIAPKLQQCHIIFVSRTQKDALPHIKRICELRPCLTVSDIGKFTSEGGMIEVFRDGKKLWFDVNRSAYERCRLRINDQFLAVARRVLTEQE